LSSCKSCISYDKRSSMPGQKRTYSSKGRGIADPDFTWKRLKTIDSDNELRWPDPKPRRPQQSSLLLKKGLQHKFSGPVSFTEDYDSDTASVVEDPRKGKLKPVTSKAKKTHGSMPDLEDAMYYEPTTTKSSYGRAPSHLPTPPVEMQKQQKKYTSHFFNCTEGNTNLATQVTTPAWKRTATPNSSEVSFDSKRSKEPYVPKQYAADKAWVAGYRASPTRRSCK
jgi:hypothetical protein